MSDPTAGEAITSRKADHLDLCATDDVAFREATTLLEQVTLIHDALPELALSEVDSSAEIVGHLLRAPVVIAAMTAFPRKHDAGESPSPASWVLAYAMAMLVVIDGLAGWEANRSLAAEMDARCRSVQNCD